MLVTLDDDVFAERFGQSPADVLALPGWMRTRADFSRVLDGLNALSVDLPGFGGATPAPVTAAGSSAYADRLERALASGVLAERFVLVGHSFGGRVAAQLAARHPTRIRGLVLVSAPLLRRDDQPAPRISWTHRAARWANKRGLLSDERLEARRRTHGSLDYRNSSGIMRGVLVAVVNESYDEPLRAIAAAKVPTELVWGRHDGDVPVRTAERLAALLGNSARLSVVEAAGHLVPIDAPDAVRASIDRLAGS